MRLLEQICPHDCSDVGVCERGDAECSQRKRRLAREEIDKFKADPGGAAGVFALLALRPLLRLARRDDEEDA